MTYQVKDIRERYGVSEQTVLKWIHSGELKAIDVSPQRKTRPKWRISEDALKAFEQLRECTVPPPAPIRRKKRPTTGKVYYQ